VPLSIEAIVLGRNDDYEPQWAEKLDASLRYNHALFQAAQVDYRVAFVEWNPPRDRPLLSPALVERFSFLRALVIEPSVHEALCISADLTMMLNYGYNPALRTSTADFCLITSGDLFFGRSLVERIARGLRRGCLYRAERVNIRNDLDVGRASPEIIEEPQHVTSVNTCSEPPYNVPPYSHASGDFLLVDRVTMSGLRGFDESIRFARLHLDSRFCFTALHAGLDCELIGRIYHLDHRNAYTNRPSDYPGRPYDYRAGLPYLNPPDWGLARFEWSRVGNRLWHIRMPVRVASPAWMPPALAPDEIDAADAVTERLAHIRSAQPPERPLAGAEVVDHPLPLDGLQVSATWSGASLVHHEGSVDITTVPMQWGYSASMPVPENVYGPTDCWHWLGVRVKDVAGAVGIGILRDEQLFDEKFLSDGESTLVWLPLEAHRAQALMIRNVAPGQPSSVTVTDLRVTSQAKANLAARRQLLASVPEMASLRAQ
jgi:hypothetical protein